LDFDIIDSGSAMNAMSTVTYGVFD